MHRLFILVILTLSSVIFVACSSNAVPTNTSIPPTISPIITPTSTLLPSPTAIPPTPTYTPIPSPTPEPTLKPGYSIETLEYKSFMDHLDEIGVIVTEQIIKDVCVVHSLNDYDIDNFDLNSWALSEQAQKMMDSYPDPKTDERYGPNLYWNQVRAFTEVLMSVREHMSPDTFKDYCQNAQ